MSNIGIAVVESRQDAEYEVLKVDKSAVDDVIRESQDAIDRVRKGHEIGGSEILISALININVTILGLLSQQLIKEE